MELILWRHADAAPGADDLERKLTAKGRKQAARMAAWLQQHLPEKYSIYSSPAKRALQTANALGVTVNVSELLSTDASVADVLKAVGWPGDEGSVVIVVGHQPTFGRVVARLVGDTDSEVSIQKGALWWIEARTKMGKTGVLVRAVTAPEFV